jgi:hypothetical protein
VKDFAELAISYAYKKKELRDAATPSWSILSIGH